MFATCALAAYADDDIKNQDFNPITTGVNSLSISPDARGASMGDLGAATDPDVNSQYWNASKYAFAESTAGVSLSYTVAQDCERHFLGKPCRLLETWQRRQSGCECFAPLFLFG